MSATLLHTIRDRNSAVAVLFLHGFSGNPITTWGRLPEWIANDARLADWDLFSVGYTTRLVPDIIGIWSADAPLDRLSLMLYTATTLPALQKYRSLALVAHSMGGLLVQRVLVDHADLAQRVCHVVLFGTPSAGLPKAGIFHFLKRQVRDMGDQSDFVQNLRASWKTRFEQQSPFRFMAVAGDQDEFVPAQSSIEPFPQAQRAVVPGNHLEIVKPDDVNSPSAQLLLRVLIGEAGDAGHRSAARLAVESREFRRAVQLLEGHKDELDDQGLGDLAIALEQTGRQAEAIQLLEKQAQGRMDPMGVLAGRLKRRWLAERRQSDAERAEALYQEGYRLAIERRHVVQARYHGINLAFFKLAFRGDRAAAQEVARQVIEQRDPSDSGPWPHATQGEANLILGEPQAALDHYRAALAQNPKPWQVDSMFQQALRIADLIGDEATFADLTALHDGSAAAEA